MPLPVCIISYWEIGSLMCAPALGPPQRGRRHHLRQGQHRTQLEIRGKLVIVDPRWVLDSNFCVPVLQSLNLTQGLLQSRTGPDESDFFVHQTPQLAVDLS